MSDLRKFLIILINYNNWKDTIECIDSLVESYIRLESILVIDNGSKNDSLFYFKEKYPSIVIIENRKNIGFSAANNVGIRMAISKGFTYAILLNNDTVIPQNAISELVSVMDKYHDVSLGTGQIRMYPDKNKIWYAGGKLIGWRGLAVHNNFNKNIYYFKNNINATKVNFISGCYMCLRLSHIEKLGFLDERFFMYLEDIEYCARATKNNLAMLFVPNSIIYHKVSFETSYNSRVVYYSLRNRLLLIKLTFPFIAKLYFSLVILIKGIYWYFRNKSRYSILSKAIKDYNNNYFGEFIPD